MDKLNNILIVIIGILLILPLLGVTAVGTLSDGIAAWVIAIAVLIIGILGVIKDFK